MRELKPKLINTQYTTFTGKVAKFSTLPFKELVLLVDVKYYDLKDGKWKDYRDHLWMDNFLCKKNIQGKQINFSGVEYIYTNSVGRTNKGIKFTNHMLVIKRNNKYSIYK